MLLGDTLTTNELDSLLEVLQRRGVRTYQIKSKEGVDFRLELGPAPLPPAVVEEERKRSAKELEAERERLLYAATEGFPP